MSPTLAFASVLPAPTLAPPATAFFRVRRSPAAPTYHQLVLEDDQGSSAQWIISLTINHLNK